MQKEKPGRWCRPGFCVCRLRWTQAERRSTISFLISAMALAGIQALRAGPRAVHDGVAAVQLERVFQVVQALAGVLVARVGDPAVGLQQDGRAQVLVAVPPVAGAAGRAAGAQDALVQAVELLAVLRRLQALAWPGCRALRAQPRLDRGVLRVEMRQVRHQVLDHRHVRQRVDSDLALATVLDGRGAGQRVGTVDVHRAAAADALAAGTAKGQRRIDLVLDLQQRVQNHRAAAGQVHLVGVHARILAIVRTPAIDLEGTRFLRALCRVVLALLDPGVFR